jgi:hypothetical protein
LNRSSNFLRWDDQRPKSLHRRMTPLRQAGNGLRNKSRGALEISRGVSFAQRRAGGEVIAAMMRDG